MFKLVDADIDGMMSRAKYIVILGLVCLCLLMAPAMAETKACSKCTPKTMPAFGTVCPAACYFELGASFFVTDNEKALEDNFIVDFSDPIADALKDGLPGTSILSGANGDVKIPELDLMVSTLSAHNVEKDLQAQFVPFKSAPFPAYTKAK